MAARRLLRRRDRPPHGAVPCRLPGAPAAVAAARARAAEAGDRVPPRGAGRRARRVTLGLLTGNLEPCARLKLAPLGLNGHFAFGAYGSDHEDRHRLPAVAVERAHAATGLRFAGKASWSWATRSTTSAAGAVWACGPWRWPRGRRPRDASRRKSPDALLAGLRRHRGVRSAPSSAEGGLLACPRAVSGYDPPALATVDDFLALDVRVGTIVAARVLRGARTPAFALSIDFGALGSKSLGRPDHRPLRDRGPRGSAGRRRGERSAPRRVAGFDSEVLVLAVDDGKGENVLLMPERPVPDGGKVA